MNATLADRLRNARAPALGIALLALVLAIAFWSVLLAGDGLRASLGAPGVTDHGPASWAQADAFPPPVPVADGVAAYIDEPLAIEVHRQLARGETPVWNPHDGLGVPLLGNWQTSIPNPLRVLVDLWPDSESAWDATYLLRLLVAGAGALLLALHLGLELPGAIAAGLTFMLSGYFVRYLQMHHLNGEVWLPWLWLAADALARRPRPAALLGFVLVVYAVVTGGNPQPMLVAAVASGGFALWRAKLWGARGLMWVVLAAIPPVLIAAPYWLSGLEYVRQSVSHHSAIFGGDAYTPAGALGFFLPAPFARPDGGSPYWSEVAPWLGTVPLALALVALRARGREIFLGVLLLLCAGKIAGLWGTGWIGALPGFSMMKLFKYLYPPAGLALALLCGGGVVALWHNEVRLARLATAVAIVAAVLAVLVGAALHAQTQSALLEFVGWKQLAFVVLLLGALVTVVVIDGRGQPVAGGVALALVALELVVAAPDRWLPRRDPFAKPAYLQAFRGEREASFRTFGAYGMLIPNQNAVFGIDDIRLHDGVFPSRYATFVRRFLEPNVRHWPVFTGEDLGTRQSMITDGLKTANLLLPQQVAQDVQPSVPVDLLAPTPARYLDLTNVRYLILPRWFPGARGTGDVGAYLRARATPDVGKIVFEDDVALVFERRTALPRAWFPARVERVTDADAAFDRMADDAFDGRDVGYLETDEPVGDQPDAGSALVLERPSAGELSLQVQSTRPGWLLVSIYPYPGMQAEVVTSAAHGEPTTTPALLVPADGTLSAIAVPRGRYHVHVSYHPTWEPLAWWLAAGGALALAALAFCLRRRHDAEADPDLDLVV